MIAQNPRTNRACVICHKRKIRCDFGNTPGLSCSNCIRDGYDCLPRERKRKRYTLSLSPPAEKRHIRQKNGSAAPIHDAQADVGGSSVIGSYAAGSPSQAPNLCSPGTDRAVSRPVCSSVLEDETGSSTADRSNVRGALPTHIPAFNSIERRASRVSYLGRSEYISNDVPIDDGREMPHKSLQTVSERDMEILQMQQVFDLPPRSIRDSLFDSFWAHCYPWTPIVEKSWVEGLSPDQISPLLMQAILLAGSRVLSAPLAYGSPEEFYKKAKMLFWMGVEKDPIITISAVCLLHWWNPEGPEHVSIDTSGFWLRISVGLAYQVGLHREPSGKKPDASVRRRLWWSLVVRDCLINAGHGRPRAINIDLTDVNPPSIADFSGDEGFAELFGAYVEVSRILGDLTQCFLEKHQFHQQKKILEDRLFRWIRTLPDELRLCGQQPERLLQNYSFEARQLHVQYFTILTILNKSLSPCTSPSTASLLASSFIAGIFEEFLARDEIRFLGPIFTFYLLVAGVTQLSCYKYAELWDLADHDIEIIFRSQEELAKRWPSALGALKNLSNVRDKVMKQPHTTCLPAYNLSRAQTQFFEPFGPELCREWDVLFHEPARRQSAVTRDLMTAGKLHGLRTPASAPIQPAPAPPYDEINHQIPNANISPTMTANENSLVAHLLGPDLMNQYGGGVGDWLNGDWEGSMMW